MEYVMKAYNAAEDEVIKKLSKWYKFDAKEAKKRLHMSEEPSIPLPFSGEIKSDWCLGMKKNHNLYSQCTGKRINERLCNKCQKEEDKLGKVKEGYIEERLCCNLMDYKDVQNYGNVLEKLNITKEKAMEEAARFNIVIPEEQFEVKKKTAQRGRPNNSKQPKEVVLNNKKEEDVKATKKEEKEVNNSLGEGGQGDVNPPKKRGRPKKEEKKVVNNCGEELIAALVNEAQKKETEDVFETAKKAKAESKKKEEQAKQEQAKQEQAKQEQAKQEQAKQEQAKQEAKKKAEQAKQEEQKKQEEAKQEEGVWGNSKFPRSDELCEEEVNEDDSEEESEKEDIENSNEVEEEEEITVSKFEFNGIKYLKSSDNILYDPISQDPVGIWNEDEECIDEIEEDDEE